VLTVMVALKSGAAAKKWHVSDVIRVYSTRVDAKMKGVDPSTLA
jgi:hypothetical protein